jgi:hypothetical protein
MRERHCRAREAHRTLTRGIPVTLLFAAALLIAAGPALSRGMIAQVIESWIICGTRETAQRLSIYVRAGDQFGMDSIISHGLGVNVGDGTRVKIIGAAGGYVEVRIIDGINNGYPGWISRDLLVESRQR